MRHARKLEENTMATQKKLDIENPTSEIIENLEPSAPSEDGFHITKLSERDSKRFIDILADDSEPSEEVKANWRRAKESYDRLILGRRP